MRHRCKTPVRITLASAAIGLIVLTAGDRATALIGAAPSSKAAPEIMAQAAGTGRFHPTVLPKGFKLFLEDDETIPGTPTEKGNASNDPSTAIPLHVQNYSLYNAADRADRASKGLDSGPVLSIVVARDPKALLAMPFRTSSNAEATTVRGRQAEIIQPNPSASVDAIHWNEHNGLAIQVSGTGVSISDVTAVAKGLVEDK